jgi:hypothetical protein
MYEIHDILHRRTDRSTFLVHLTRTHEGTTAKDRLRAIYDDRKLIAGSPMGWAAERLRRRDPDSQDAQSQRVVCFSETIAKALNKLRDDAIASGAFHQQPVARVFPFVEPLGKFERGPREFSWEREWRRVRTLHFGEHSAIFLCPEDEIEEFVPPREGEATSEWDRRNRRFVDPRWGLERIMAHLSGT